MFAGGQENDRHRLRLGQDYDWAVQGSELNYIYLIPVQCCQDAYISPTFALHLPYILHGFCCHNIILNLNQC